MITILLTTYFSIIVFGLIAFIAYSLFDAILRRFKEFLWFINLLIRWPILCISCILFLSYLWITSYFKIDYKYDKIVENIFFNFLSWPFQKIFSFDKE